MIIDIHAHIAYAELFPDYFLDGIKKIIQESIMIENEMSIPQSLLDRIVCKTLNDSSCKKLISEMDAAGISQTVLLITDMEYGQPETALPIEEIYKFFYQILQKSSERFIVFAGIDPRRGRSGLELFEKGIKEYHFTGLKLYPSCGFGLSDPELFPFYELCEFYKVPVLSHTGPSLGSMPGEKNYPASVYEAAKKYKNVPFILGHAAFQNFDTNLKLAVELDNVYLEVSGFQKLMPDVESMNYYISTLFNLVPEKVLFGTDWPMFNMNGTQKQWVSYFQNHPLLSYSHLQKFLYLNAKKVLNI